MNDRELKPFDIPLNGKLITSEDPLLIGNNFRSLKNLRYTGGTVKGIGGMSKVNTTALAYTDLRSGIYFNKVTPEESHFLVHTVSGSNSKVYTNDTTVPNAGDFNGTEVHSGVSGAGVGRFALAPDSAVAYCNGEEALIWGGNESRCAGYINYDPAGTFQYDYTEQVNNTLTDSLNVATFGVVTGGLDSNTMLLLHLDNNVTDSSPTTPHTVTNNNVTFSTVTKVFGTHAAYFNGTTANLTVPDGADFDFSSGNFTIDLRCYASDLAASHQIYYHGTDANNYFSFYINTSGAVVLSIYAAGAEVVALSTSNGVISAGGFYHIELSEDDNEWYIFINGYLQATVTDADRAANYTGTVYIGNDGAAVWFKGYIDEFRISNTPRHIENFEVPSVAYSSSSSTGYLYIGAVRPIRGMKLYVQTVNTSAGSMSVDYWGGSSWVAVTNLVDGTSSSGVSLAQTGSVTFNSTVNTCKIKSISQIVLYWYRVSLTAVDAATSIYYVTTNMAFQPIKDLWDGSFRSVASFKVKKTTYNDYTLNVYGEDYVSLNDATFANVGGLTTSQYMVVGFAERMMGLKFVMVETNVNTTASTVMTVSYWNGASWVSVGSIDDGTIDSSKSMAQSGVVTWNPPASNIEFTQELAGVPMYYYKVSFNKTLSANVKIDFVGGITTQKDIKGYKFPIFSQNRLILCGGKHRKNSALVSATGTNCVFNGKDTTEFIFGSDKELVTGGSIFTQVGSNLYDLMIFCKVNETWAISGYGNDTWSQYCASYNIGCPAPLTWTVVDVGPETISSLNRQVAIWRTSSGITMFDGKNFTPIDADIKDLFDEANPGVNFSMIDRETGFYDLRNHEWHWCFAGAGSSTLNKELVYSVKYQKWYEIVRPSGKQIQIGIQVNDTKGNNYIYGLGNNGHAYHLEKAGAYTFDGSDIAYEVYFGDSALAGGMLETKLRKLRVITKTKTTPVIVTHYGDGSTTGTARSMSQTKAGHRVATSEDGSNSPAYTFHSLKLTASSNDTTPGFEPLGVSGHFKLVREV